MVPKLLSLDYLKSTKSAEATPFELEIPGREPFFCEEIFRYLPGKISFSFSVGRDRGLG